MITFSPTLKIIVRLGEHDDQTDPDCDDDGFCGDPVQDYEIEKIITHENFNPETFWDDIALIKLKKAVNFTGKNINLYFI